ncbi:MAG: hypothetical protein IJL87_03455, partial [Clostridia bacterium]|nr:hypothetical protein [Clostridia bacterium]
MVKLIIGEKGSGKTKKLVNMVNDAAHASSGSVVCVEKGNVMTYDISHKARLIDIDHYGVSGYEQFFGFICGLCAGNYDITDIFIDSTLKVCGRDMEQLADFVEKLGVLSDKCSVNFALSIS